MAAVEPAASTQRMLPAVAFLTTHAPTRSGHVLATAAAGAAQLPPLEPLELLLEPLLELPLELPLLELPLELLLEPLLDPLLEPLSLPHALAQFCWEQLLSAVTACGQVPACSSDRHDVCVAAVSENCPPG